MGSLPLLHFTGPWLINIKNNNNENKSIFISLYHRYEIRLNLIENKLTLVTVF